jgi:hypothetical protein
LDPGDYNVEFKTPNQVGSFYDAGPYRSSDHDPVVIGLDLTASPQVVIQNTRVKLAALAAGAGKHDADRLSHADKELAKVLDPKWWVDGTHVTPKGGEAVFTHLKNAVKVLSALAQDKKSAIPPATLEPMIDDLVAVAALLASTAVNDAIAAGGPADRVGRAQDELARAAAARAAGDPDGAIGHYKAAWQKAQEAIRKV